MSFFVLRAARKNPICVREYEQFVGRSEAQSVGAARDLVGWQLIGPPAAGDGRCAARTEGPFTS